MTRVREETAGLPADHRVASAYARMAAAELAAELQAAGADAVIGAMGELPAAVKRLAAHTRWAP